MNTRNFKVKGEISSLFKPEDITYIKQVKGIEVELWHKSPMLVIFLGKAQTDATGGFVIEFQVDSPVSYIVEGKISDVFIKAFYNGQEITEKTPFSLLDDLVAYWKLDELSGTLAADSSGKGHTGTLTGTVLPAWEYGKINNGLTFYGNTDGSVLSYLYVPASEDFNFGTGDFTITLWMKSNNLTGEYCLYDSGYGAPNNLLMHFQPSNQVDIYVNSKTVINAEFTIEVDTWYHITLLRREDQLSLFINGEVVSSVVCADVITCPGSKLTLGSYTDGIQNLDGMMDEIGIWKGRALTQADITNLYNDGNGRQYPFV